jgi:hypothetical protein
MIVKTKKYQLPKNTYIKIGLVTLLKSQWWLFSIPLAILCLNFIDHAWYWYLIAFLVPVLYIVFWLIQFAGVTQLEQGKMLFEKLSYEIDSRQIMIKLNPKQGSPVQWNMIKKAYKGQDDFLLILSKAQFIHLPFKIFNSDNEIKFVESILKRKELLK